MNSNDIVLLGLKQSVTAISKADGGVVWCTELGGGGMGGSFVTLICDAERIFAYSGGSLFCLELTTGRFLWQNELSGYGYGLASLCVPGFGSAPDTATITRLLAQQEAAAAGAGSAGS
jgi:outer membrane protein assembly factor BamB